MPMDFTATVLDDVKIKIADIFPADQQVSPEFFASPVTLEGLAENQTALVSDEFIVSKQNGCIQRQVQYLKADNITSQPNSATPIALNCEIPTGDGLSSDVRLYNSNQHFTRTLSISDKDCANYYKFAEKVSRGIASMMALIANDINVDTILKLQAGSQAITAGNEGKGTIVGTTLQYPSASFDDDTNGRLISEWETIAISETIEPNFLVLDGKNLTTTLEQARYNAQNDNQRAAAARFFDGRHMFYRDVRTLSATTGDASTFLVDKNMYAYYSAKIYDDQLVQLGDKNVTSTFSLPLMYKGYDGTGKTLQFMTESGMQTAYVNVRYQKACDPTSNSVTGQVMMHNWEISYAGMFDFAPTETTKTGVINVVKV